MSPSRARTRTVRSGVAYTNHEATSPPTFHVFSFSFATMKTWSGIETLWNYAGKGGGGWGKRGGYCRGMIQCCSKTALLECKSWKGNLITTKTLNGVKLHRQLVSKPIVSDSKFLVWCAVLLQAHQEQATYFLSSLFCLMTHIPFKTFRWLFLTMLKTVGAEPNRRTQASPVPVLLTATTNR